MATTYYKGKASHYKDRGEDIFKVKPLWFKNKASEGWKTYPATRTITISTVLPVNLSGADAKSNYFIIKEENSKITKLNFEKIN